jgi:hypothetical protein
MLRLNSATFVTTKDVPRLVHDINCADLGLLIMLAWGWHGAADVLRDLELTIQLGNKIVRSHKLAQHVHAGAHTPSTSVGSRIRFDTQSQGWIVSTVTADAAVNWTAARLVLVLALAMELTAL